jgi:hypothetical protein
MLPPKSNVLNVFDSKNLRNDELMQHNNRPVKSLGVDFECKKLAEFYIRMFRDQEKSWLKPVILFIFLVRVIVYIVMVSIYFRNDEKLNNSDHRILTSIWMIAAQVIYYYFFVVNILIVLLDV